MRFLATSICSSSPQELVQYLKKVGVFQFGPDDSIVSFKGAIV